VGGYQRAGVQSRLRAAVNARLEEISFRAGVAAATIALVTLSVIAAAGVYTVTVRLGGQAVAAAGALSAAGAAKTAHPATTVAQPATTAPPATTTRPTATATPQATHPATTSPQPAAGSQPWPQADGAQGSSGYYGRAGFGSWYGGRGSWPGRGGHGFGFPGREGWGRP
jgi:hypothetical protein